MADFDYIQLIKWILIVLAAGFIGQFGKSLATYLIKKARASKTADMSEAVTGSVKQAKEQTPTAPPVTPPVTERKELQGKTDKKAAKALIKLRKKESKQ